ncbi:hypothetical protein HIMB100_00012360 [SAR116 cluster alpha proteobacterium HIMB100]|nr:hypothetical protein HIMB100_00012360 [SAR116 cluster alpha proteobacterium HIMB100]
MESGDSTLLTGIILIVILLLGYWALRGIGQLFERYNPILVIFYLFLLFPVAMLHAFILGMFGRSKKERLQKAVEDEVDHQLRVEREKERRLK